MLYQTLFQSHEFVAMALTGAVMAAVSLVFSALRRLMCVGKWGCLLCDCLMGLVWAVIGAVSLTEACRGEARAFHFLAMLSGALLFMAGVSPAARAFAGKIGKFFAGAVALAGKNRVIRAIFR